MRAREREYVCLCVQAKEFRVFAAPPETYYSVKRDLLQCQKRPITVSKDTYYSVKRDLLQCQEMKTTHTVRQGPTR